MTASTSEGQSIRLEAEKISVHPLAAYPQAFTCPSTSNRGDAGNQAPKSYIFARSRATPLVSRVKTAGAMPQNFTLGGLGGEEETHSSLPLHSVRFPAQTCSSYTRKLRSGWLRGGGGDLQLAPAPLPRANLTQTLEYSDIPTHNYDYSRVLRSCVVCYIPIPLSVAGPLNIDGELVHIPVATAGGTLIASTSTVLTNDAVTRGPAIDFPSIVVAAGDAESERHPDWGLEGRSEALKGCVP
ncbi:hypothetical protein DFJ58DRAFT_861158 [Suillus subalutaceus]|uniref:uncharacterized protein n=1 Tax=Suillus subalutaceus TaxID=48586 RepID=UPI001B884364|nr:uncharacterized protein DFJ58DRAFT_861158 [Suillus subalutaceus]KAG1838450.1 hypothetical protein DFJ58DRAFT_861158 [Suillus subalutaceus]